MAAYLSFFYRYPWESTSLEAKGSTARCGRWFFFGSHFRLEKNRLLIVRRFLSSNRDLHLPRNAAEQQVIYIYIGGYLPIYI